MSDPLAQVPSVKDKRTTATIQKLRVSFQPMRKMPQRMPSPLKLMPLSKKPRELPKKLSMKKRKQMR